MIVTHSGESGRDKYDVHRVIRAVHIIVYTILYLYKR